MSQADQIRVNGNMMSWGSIIVKIDGQTFHGFTSVSYADKRERVLGYGMGRHHGPRGRSSGKYSPETSKLGGPKESHLQLRKMLAAKAADGRSYGNVVFEVVIQFVEPGSSDEAQTVELEQCVYIGSSSSHEEGPDPLKEETEIQPLRIRRNGLTLWDDNAGAVL